MPPKAKEIFQSCRDEEQWKELISKENKKITVVDFYYPWFGRCDVLDEALRGLYMGIDDSDKKMQYFNVDLTKIPVFKETRKSPAKPLFQIWLVFLKYVNFVGWTNEMRN